MSDMASVIDARETKLVEMSKESVQLKDANIELQEYGLKTVCLFFLWLEFRFSRISFPTAGKLNS